MNTSSPQTVRPPAVAGQFYPAEADRLQQQLGALLTEQIPCGQAPKALIVPHAGYVYSGPVAASAYRMLLHRPGEFDTCGIERVVLLGPSHRVPLTGMAVPSVDAFATPLGSIPIDKSGVAALARLPGVHISDAPHESDHALEVQLPFLQTCLHDFRLLAVSVGRCPAQTVASALAAVWGGAETLIVLSTDLSHFHHYRHAQRIDRVTAEAILRCDSTLDGDQACGSYALNGLLLAARQRRMRVELLDLRSSGDTAGDHNRVVGYASFAIHEADTEANQDV